ncbi:copper transporter 1-like [Tripterygium wilfordii]|uniref:Copper transport protein n=1 Tax=Tripterygium wilfordii TaxID=458696 RepID=A0A7J7DYE8_TRIWF|nr:copper transporter 6-like [Tripterygium wilfordii]KAF5751412.1 copper transporter 1-like [Tripterygium wilfordii]
MDGMHDHGMGDMGMGMGMDMGAPPPMGHFMPPHQHMMMRMTFFWGKNVEVLFKGWPGHSSNMYAVSLIVVFFLGIIVEWLSHCQLIKAGTNHVAAGLVQTVMHALRVGVSLLLMLAVMSFNGGVFLAAVVGHTVGFLLFGSGIFKKSDTTPPHKTFQSDLPPMTC